MQLAVNQFYKYQPASKWAFEAAFSNPMLVTKKVSNGTTYQLESMNTFTQQDLERISQAVVSITQPKFDIEPYTNTYGNFDFVVPIYDVNNIRMTVTFEDTDDCLISYKFLTSLMGGSTKTKAPAWLNVHETILLTITEYNTYAYDLERPNTLAAQYRNWNSTTVKSYFCKMIDYTEPNYNRTSEDPSATTMQITFLAVPALPMIVDDSPILSNGVEQVDVKSIYNELKTSLTKMFSTIGYAFKSGLGFMADKTVNLKDVYADLKTWYGNNVPASRAEIEEWFNKHALSCEPLGQCSRGPNMLLQLFEYIESGEAARGDDRFYKSAGAADTLGKGTGINATTKQTISDTTDTRFNIKEFSTTSDLSNAITTNLKPGEYVTFTYTKANGEKSQHVVFRSFDGKSFWSDFNQNTGSGIKSGTNFQITGSYKVENSSIAADKFGVQQTDSSTAPGVNASPLPNFAH